MAHRTGAQSVDVWGNTAKDGSGTDYQLLVDGDGKLQVVSSGSASAASATNTSVTVGATSTSVLAASTRLSVTLVNDSDETIYVSIDGAASMNSGIRLNANGGSLTVDATSGASLAFNAICASGSKVLTVNYTA